MTVETRTSLNTVYAGWDEFQRDLVKVVAPLTAEQLALPVAPGHWAVGTHIQHMINDRIWWFSLWMHEADAATAALMDWDESKPLRTANELVAGLEATWTMIANTLARHTVADLSHTFPQPDSLDERERAIFGPATRQEIIFHVLRHDFHHGGELAACLGSHHLPSIWG
jgi:uncharacterized damage-inducible protein DinB